MKGVNKIRIWRSLNKAVGAGGRSRSFRDVLYVGAVQLATLLLPLVTAPWILRALQPSAFGKYSLALAVVQFGIIIVDFGFILSATQHIAKIRDSREEVTRYFWTVQYARLILMFGSGIVILAVILCVPTFQDIFGVAIAYLPVLAGTLIFPQWLFLGLGRVREVSIVNIVARVLLVPLIILFVRQPSDAALAAFLSASSYIVSGIICAGLIARWKLLTGFIRPKFKSAMEVSRDSWPLFVSNIAFSLYSTLNTVILGAVKGNYEVGLFSAADKLRFAAQTPSRAISTVFFPRVSRALSQDRRNALIMLAGLTAALSLVGLAVCGGLFFLSDIVIRLFAGSSFGGSVSVLKILSLVCVVSAINTAFGTLGMVNLGMKREFSWIVVSSGLVNVALLLWLGRKYGADGAAISVLTTEVLVCVLMATALLRKGVLREVYKALSVRRSS